MTNRRLSGIPLPGMVDNMENLSLQDNFQYLHNRREGRLNIVVIGKTGEGKSATINSLIAYADDPKPDLFKEEQSPLSVTKAFQECIVKLFRLNCRLVDTMGLFDTETTPERKAQLQVMKIPDLEEEHKVVLANLTDVVTLCSDGIDAFLLVIDGTSRLTRETMETINIIQRFYGISMLDHCIFVLTKLDAAKNDAIEKMKEAISDYLRKIGYSNIGDRFVLFDNKNRPKHQVVTLLKTIEGNLEKRGGLPYTHIAFDHAQQLLAKEKVKLQQQLEAQLQQQIEVATSKIRGDYEQRMKSVQSQLDEKSRLIDNLREDAVEERQKFQNEMSNLNKQMVKMEKDKVKDIDTAVKKATAKCNEEYLESFRRMENKYQAEHALLRQENREMVNSLKEQIEVLANRPAEIREVHHHHHTVERESSSCVMM